jgi:hypothetical protein
MLKEALAAPELVTVQQVEENAELCAMLASRGSRITELNARLSDREERFRAQPRKCSVRLR